MIITGKNAIIEAIKANHEIKSVFVKRDTNQDLYDLAKQHKLNIQTLNGSDERIRRYGSISADILEYKLKSLNHLFDPTHIKRFVMFDHIEDPHNVGAVMRSVDALGFDGVILPKDRQASITDTVVSVSAGAIEYIDLIEITNVSQALKQLKEHGYWIVGADMNGDTELAYIPKDLNLIVVLGNEGKGLSKHVKNQCDFVVSIPMRGHVDSLNVSVSAGIILQAITSK
jgi:23S rRNA (guanosine2251-2'-O)-methyltransferase